jgi:hypothetical protein
MTANQSRLLGVALLAVVIATIAQLSRREDAADGAAGRGSTPEALAKKQAVELDLARAKARFENGAFIQRSKRISDTEELQIIVVPEGYTEELDTRCIVYRNLQSGTSSISCTGVLFRQPAAPS